MVHATGKLSRASVRATSVRIAMLPIYSGHVGQRIESKGRRGHTTPVLTTHSCRVMPDTRFRRPGLFI